MRLIIFIPILTTGANGRDSRLRLHAVSRIALSMALCMVSSLFSGPALGATIHVPGQLPTIQEGLDEAVSGDVVLVAPGTYVETIDFLGKDITLRSEQGSDVTSIDGHQAGSVVIFAGGETGEAVLEGFTIRNGTGTYIELGPGYQAYCGGGILCSGTSPTIVNCTIADNSADHGGGFFCVLSASPTIQGCSIVWNRAVYTGGGGAGYYWSSFTILSSNIAGNTGGSSGGGVHLYCSALTAVNSIFAGNIADSGGGIYFCNVIYSQMITNCTIADNSAVGTYGAGGGVYYTWGTPLSITNSILWGNSAAHYGAHYEQQIFGPAFVFNSDVEGGGPGSGVIDMDPLFVGGGDYHLTAESPCIDAGASVAIHTDMDGDWRPAGCGFDIGADESTECHDCDGDHYSDEACGGADCDDADPLINPDADEICTGGADEDCDGLVDGEDPDCFTGFTLELHAAYEEDTLSLDFTVGTLEPALWEAFLIATYPTVQVVPLWVVSLPVVDPSVDIPISFPLPSAGWVAIYSRLLAGGELGADEFVWVDTGGR